MSAQAELILEQFSIPNVLTQDIKTVHRYVKGLTMNYDHAFTSEVGTELLSILAKDELSKNYMDAQVPNRTVPKGKGKGKDKSKDDSVTPVPEGLGLLTPIGFPEDPGLQPETPLYSPQQYWEDSVRRQLMTPDYRGHNNIRCACNTDPIQFPYTTEPSDTLLPRKVRIRPSQESWTFHRSSRPTRTPEAETATCPNTSIYSHLELVRMNANDVHTPARFDRWVFSPMVRMRYVFKYSIQQRWKSLSLLQTACDVAQSMPLS